MGITPETTTGTLNVNVATLPLSVIVTEA